MLLLALAACTRDGGLTLVGEWGGGCTMGGVPWSLGLQLEASASTVVGSGEWEVTDGTETIDWGNGPFDKVVLGVHCTSRAGCVSGETPVDADQVSIEVDMGQGYRFLLQGPMTEADHLEGMAYYGSDAVLSRSGPFTLDRGAPPGDVEPLPEVCALPLGTCPGVGETCAVDHFTSTEDCGVCGNACAADCAQGQCPEVRARRGRLVVGGTESCLVRDGEVLCWPIGQAGPVTIVHGDAVQVAIDDVRRCVVTRGGTVECTETTPPAVPVDPPPAWTDVVEITLAQSLCALDRAGAVRCHDWNDGERDVLVAERGATFVTGNRGGYPGWQLAGGQLRSRYLTTVGDVPGDGLVDWAIGGAGMVGVRADGAAVQVGTDPPVEMGVTGVVQAASGWFHGLLLRGDGTVVGWGFADTPAGWELQGDIPGLTDAVAVATGFGASCAERSDGRVTCWEPATPDAPYDVALP